MFNFLFSDDVLKDVLQESRACSLERLTFDILGTIWLTGG